LRDLSCAATDEDGEQPEHGDDPGDQDEQRHGDGEERLDRMCQASTNAPVMRTSSTTGSGTLRSVPLISVIVRT
jgi:hypothetical protein